jgi:hypothetical protein
MAAELEAAHAEAEQAATEMRFWSGPRKRRDLRALRFVEVEALRRLGYSSYASFKNSADFKARFGVSRSVNHEVDGHAAHERRSNLVLVPSPQRGGGSDHDRNRLDRASHSDDLEQLIARLERIVAARTHRPSTSAKERDHPSLAVTFLVGLAVPFTYVVAFFAGVFLWALVGPFGPLVLVAVAGAIALRTQEAIRRRVAIRALLGLLISILFGLSA